MRLIIVLGFVLFFIFFACSTVGAQSTSFSFGAAGDFGKSADATAVLQSIGQNGLQFFITLGDLSYADIQPETAWCDYVKTNIGNSTFPFELISGNHDDDTPVGYNINAFSQCLPHRLGNIQGTYAKEYYTDYPQTSPLARFILISPNMTLDGIKYTYSKGTSRYNWLSAAIDDARSRSIPWVIVGMHENCITVGVKSCSISIDLVNLLVEKKVDLILQGHDHTYQRSKQFALTGSCTALQANIYNPSCVADDGADKIYTKGAGPVLIIVGTGGQGLYNVTSTDSEAGYFATWMGANINARKGFVKYTVSAAQLTGQFIGATAGTFTDNFTIQKGTLTVPPTVPVTPTLTPTAPAGQCPFKSQGDANCKKDLSQGVLINVSLIDFEIWRKEAFAQCSAANLAACGIDEDSDGNAMDANFNYPGSPYIQTDTAVNLADFEIWRKGYFQSATITPAF